MNSDEAFRCNCPHEIRAGCSEPKCPHYVRPRANEALTQEIESLRREFEERLATVHADADSAIREAFYAGFMAYFGPQKLEDVDQVLREEEEAWRKYCTGEYKLEGAANE